MTNGSGARRAHVAPAGVRAAPPPVREDAAAETFKRYMGFKWRIVVPIVVGLLVMATGIFVERSVSARLGNVVLVAGFVLFVAGVVRSIRARASAWADMMRRI